MMTQSGPVYKRHSGREIIYIEILRIIALYLVLFNHTGNYGYSLYMVSQESRYYPIYLFLSVITVCNVPIFFMISGALLLGKEESLRVLFRKRIRKFLIVLIGISFFYDVYLWRFEGAPLSLSSSLVGMYSKSSPIALWYLYSYLGTLVMLPLLRKLAKAMNARDFAYLALVQIIFSGLIPIGQFVLSRGTVTLNNYFSIPLITSQNVFFVLMGYFIHKVLDQRFFCLRYVVMANLIAFAAVVVSCLATHYSWKITGAYTLFHKSLIAVPTCALFFSAKYLFSASRIFRQYCAAGFAFWVEQLSESICSNICCAPRPSVYSLHFSLTWGRFRLVCSGFSLPYALAA